MAKVKEAFECTACGGRSPKWLGRCPSCDEWNTLEGIRVDGQKTKTPTVLPSVGPIGKVKSPNEAIVPTGIDELDRALGGGLSVGSVTLLGGPPGIGKSTLLLQLGAKVARDRGTALYVSAEESPAQVKSRAERLGCIEDRLLVASDTQLEAVVAIMEQEKPAVAIVDSVQTVADPALPSAAGSVSQVRHVAHRLTEVAKRLNVTLILVGHVTKDGGLAGPRVLEHLVDTVLSFDGDRSGDLRLLRAVKHRFGPTSEVGLFEMGAKGLNTVPDASGRFLADRQTGVPGSVVAATVAGQRPLLVEVQALVATAVGTNPRRSAQGVDSARVAMLLAVLERRVGISTKGADVFVSVAGGARATEPASDLPIALAIASAARGVELPSDLVAIGEVGLAGELRRVNEVDRRISEASRLGFKMIALPAAVAPDTPGMTSWPLESLFDAVDYFVPPKRR